MHEIPINEIYSDDEFNCRGQIAPHDVLDLANSIRDRGLMNPIMIQPVADVEGGLPDGKKYRIVAGHRRFKACLILQQETIAAFIREGLSEIDSRIINLEENFARKDLNILQEAKALGQLHTAGVARETVAKRIGKSGAWVQCRFKLLNLPYEIQQEAAAGLIGTRQIMELSTLKSGDEQYEAVKKYKSARERGENIGHIGKRKKAGVMSKKARKRDEIFECIEVMAKSVGYGLQTRCLAWAAGEISTFELFQDIKEECQKLDKPVPSFPETI